jgi:hypothetical protein
MTTRNLALRFGLLAIPACSQQPQIHEFVVNSVDYAFQAPATAPAGLTAFSLVEKGKSPHELQLFQFKKGISADSARRLLGNKNFPFAQVMPSGGILVGFPNAPVSEKILIDLKAGDVYGLRCQFQNTDSAPHHDKLGMISVLTVT